MYCEKCQKEWSDKVYRIHKDRCQSEPKVEENITKGLIMAELKRKDVKFSTRSSRDELYELLMEVRGE